MATNVPPVVGMTPSQVAAELRVLIRDQIWMKTKESDGQHAGPNAQKNREKYVVARDQAQDHIKAARMILDEISVAASHRRPNEIRALARRAHAQLNESNVRARGAAIHADYFINRVFTTVASPSGSLHQAATRAYALVQALPTVGDTPTNRAENVVRAMAAMVKVYFGVEVERTIAELPEIMPVLLESIKPPPKPPPPPSPAPPPVDEPEDLVIFNGVSVAVKLPLKIVAGGGAEFSPHDWGILPSFWNGGNCSPKDALRVLIAIREQSLTNSISLIDSQGHTFASAQQGEEMTTYYGMVKFLDELNKEDIGAPF